MLALSASIRSATLPGAAAGAGVTSSSFPSLASMALSSVSRYSSWNWAGS